MACLERAGEAESHLGPQLGPEQAARQKSASRGPSRVSRGTRGAAFLSIKTSNDSSSRRISTPQGPQRTPTLRPSPRCTPRLLSLHLYWVQNIPEFLPLAFARDVPISFHQGPGQITYPRELPPFAYCPSVPGPKKSATYQGGDPGNATVCRDSTRLSRLRPWSLVLADACFKVTCQVALWGARWRQPARRTRSPAGRPPTQARAGGTGPRFR